MNGRKESKGAIREYERGPNLNERIKEVFFEVEI